MRSLREFVVVSSTWRSDDGFRAGLRRRGARVRYHRDWRTGRLPGPEAGHCGREVADWLSRNPAVRYAIVDDGSDFLPEQIDRLVRTYYATGLLPSHAEALVALLAAQGPRPASIRVDGSGARFRA